MQAASTNIYSCPILIGHQLYMAGVCVLMMSACSSLYPMVPFMCAWELLIHSMRLLCCIV